VNAADLQFPDQFVLQRLLIRCPRPGDGPLVYEQVQAIIGFAENTLGARRVECFSDERNVASRRVAERAGFVLESIQKRVSPQGSEYQACVYARVK
jgi:RimJ/RimL family protein N-acetyltransferase